MKISDVVKRDKWGVCGAISGYNWSWGICCGNLQIADTDTEENAYLIAAAPEMLAALRGAADALKEAGKDFAISSPRAARPNLFELHEAQCRAAIARAVAP